jgi:hypothetical protein
VARRSLERYSMSSARCVGSDPRGERPDSPGVDEASRASWSRQKIQGSGLRCIGARDALPRKETAQGRQVERRDVSLKWHPYHAVASRLVSVALTPSQL